MFAKVLNVFEGLWLSDWKYNLTLRYWKANTKLCPRRFLTFSGFINYITFFQRKTGLSLKNFHWKTDINWNKNLYQVIENIKFLNSKVAKDTNQRRVEMYFNPFYNQQDSICCQIILQTKVFTSLSTGQTFKIFHQVNSFNMWAKKLSEKQNSHSAW